jgi:hypothetical protein
MQGIGFTDEVERADVDRIVDAVHKHCAELAPFTVTIGPAHVDPETMANARSTGRTARRRP